ncbi:MAG TPA: hypothetical protein VIL13_11680 [Longimicrobiales bacterium]|jgi:hypothetical protein
MTQPGTVRARRSDPASPDAAPPAAMPDAASPGGAAPGGTVPDAPGRRPASEPVPRAGVAGRSGGGCPGLVGFRYLVAVALLAALVWIPALIMIVAGHRSLPP